MPSIESISLAFSRLAQSLAFGGVLVAAPGALAGDGQQLVLPLGCPVSTAPRALPGQVWLTRETPAGDYVMYFDGTVEFIPVRKRSIVDPPEQPRRVWSAEQIPPEFLSLLVNGRETRTPQRKYGVDLLKNAGEQPGALTELQENELRDILEEELALALPKQLIRQFMTDYGVTRPDRVQRAIPVAHVDLRMGRLDTPPDHYFQIFGYDRFSLRHEPILPNHESILLRVGALLGFPRFNPIETYETMSRGWLLIRKEPNSKVVSYAFVEVLKDERLPSDWSKLIPPAVSWAQADFELP
jgi:hypothetical protein